MTRLCQGCFCMNIFIAMRLNRSLLEINVTWSWDIYFRLKNIIEVGSIEAGIFVKIFVPWNKKKVVKRMKFCSLSS